jgi:hypothetical protein
MSRHDKKYPVLRLSLVLAWHQNIPELFLKGALIPSHFVEPSDKGQIQGHGPINGSPLFFLPDLQQLKAACLCQNPAEDLRAQNMLGQYYTQVKNLPISDCMMKEGPVM